MYESTNNKLWDFKIQTVNKIELNKLEIVVLDQIEQKCLIIDDAVSTWHPRERQWLSCDLILAEITNLNMKGKT